jgi:hypothetical protein
MAHQALKVHRGPEESQDIRCSTGAFYRSKDTVNPILLIANGIQITPFVAGSKDSPEDMVYGKTTADPEAAAERLEIKDVEDAEEHWLYGKGFMGRLDGHKYLLLWKAAAQARERVLEELDGGQIQMERVEEDPLKSTTTESQKAGSKDSSEHTGAER